MKKSLIIFVFLLHSVTAAHSIMATPKNVFEPATIDQIEAVQSVAHIYNRVAGKKLEYFQFEIVLPDTKYIVVRMEGGYCKKLCLTAFFLSEISNEGFAAISYMEKTFSLGDVWTPLNDKCGVEYGVFFGTFKNGGRSMKISNCGVVF
ncbi:MAG: hypothetical protein HRU29_03635 [Rhizobiales bacterium]|nr:hypothetical protein [Hyphomicrobiales bacterium]NRB13471.1 hypothetical protein [Hyphomicrobiales bacterium]